MRLDKIGRKKIESSENSGMEPPPHRSRSNCVTTTLYTAFTMWKLTQVGLLYGIPKRYTHARTCNGKVYGECTCDKMANLSVVSK